MAFNNFFSHYLFLDIASLIVFYVSSQLQNTWNFYQTRNILG